MFLDVARVCYGPPRLREIVAHDPLTSSSMSSQKRAGCGGRTQHEDAMPAKMITNIILETI